MSTKLCSIAILLFAWSGLFGQDLEHKVWQFHVMKPDYVKQVINFAEEYDINTIVFSHKMIGETSDLYSDEEFSQRGEELRQLAMDY